MSKVPLVTGMAVCTECGWVGPFIEAKHRSHNQLVARGVINEKGIIIDSGIRSIQQRNGGWVNLTWCPNCDCFIEVYYEKKAENT